MRVKIELAGPPRGKGRGRAFNTASGIRVFTDEKTRTYESQLRFAAQQQMAGNAPTVRPVTVSVVARFPIAPSWSKKKQAAAQAGEICPCSTPDVDNLLKILDALNGVVWVDDRQIVIAWVRKHYSDYPGLTVLVESIEHGPRFLEPVRTELPLLTAE